MQVRFRRCESSPSCRDGRWRWCTSSRARGRSASCTLKEPALRITRISKRRVPASCDRRRNEPVLAWDRIFSGSRPGLRAHRIRE
eukprot:2483264-Rhodomonas_salina.2